MTYRMAGAVVLPHHQPSSALTNYELSASLIGDKPFSTLVQVPVLYTDPLGRFTNSKISLVGRNVAVFEFVTK